MATVDVEIVAYNQTHSPSWLAWSEGWQLQRLMMTTNTSTVIIIIIIIMTNRYWQSKSWELSTRSTSLSVSAESSETETNRPESEE